MQSSDLAFQAQAPEGHLRYHTAIMAHPVDLQMTGLEANGSPGEALEITATGRLNGTPVQARLRAGSLVELLRHPAGPWQDLDLDVQVENVGFQANGRVERPFEVGGFDMRFTLRGAEIETILPVLNIILPMQGAYSLSGHFADLPDRSIFDELKIVSRNSDIGGSISVYHRAQRPRLVANLHSEQIYLRDLLPVSDTTVTAGANHRVIPDYELPIDRLRGFDGELHFKGKRLRTDAGDLGDLSFTVTLQDGLLKIDPFRVRGWAGAEVEAEASIDASQQPPATNLRWIASQLNYGVLLEQAGLAETVEGTVDITLHLSGYGSTRHEFLSDANGQLIIVGQEGRFGSRRLDLWGSGLVSTMLSREWRSEDVTDINCMVARVSIKDGMAASDDLIVDTRRITIGAAGTLDLESEELNIVFAPSPKRTSLVSLTNPVHVTGTLAAPEVAVTVLPRRRMAAAGTGLLAGLVNPGYLIFTFSQAGARHANACAVAVEKAMVMKGTQEEDGKVAAEPGPRYSLLPGCSRSRRQPES